MYECLYGYTPFACDDRHQTKLKILSHKKTLVFPHAPQPPDPSIEALDLMVSILVEKEKRLCSRQYELNDYSRKIHGNKVVRCTADKNDSQYRGRFVWPGDAEDIKRHAFFRDVDWDSIHLRRPPYTPRVKGWEDTKYFQEEEPISDIDTSSVDDTLSVAGREKEVPPSKDQATQVSQHHQEGQHIVPSVGLKPSPFQNTPIPETGSAAGGSLKNPLLRPIFEKPPSTAATLVGTGGYAEGQPETMVNENPKPKTKKKEKKRPRDIILRDPVAGPVALESRKLGAFLSYEYRQPVKPQDIVGQVLAEDLAKFKAKEYRLAGDGQDRDLSFERRMFRDSGGHMLPPHMPVQRILREDLTFGRQVSGRQLTPLHRPLQHI